MKKYYRIIDALYIVPLTFCLCAYPIVYGSPFSLIPIGALFLLCNVFPGLLRPDINNDRLLVTYHGSVLLCITAATMPLSAIYYTVLGFYTPPSEHRALLWAGVYTVSLYLILIANGAISLYLTSVQLGIKWRALGILLAIIPVVNLIILGKMVARALREVDFEIMREERNRARADDKVAATKYPLVLVHGIFMRDWPIFNYWGRIPEELERNGARIYYGEHQSARPVFESAKELADRIRWIVTKTGAEKVNIIAHSKGGLDCRYAIKHYGIGPLVASLTTVNSPHRGCRFAERLLRVSPRWLKRRVENAYNKSFVFLGDKNPDFMAGVRDLAASVCEPRDKELGVPEGIFCQSVGSVQNRGRFGRFPMNVSMPYVKRFDGDNDGLVGTHSFAFGERLIMITTTGKRGISHLDVIDLSREDIKGFDVREFYVGLVSDLKSRGL